MTSLRMDKILRHSQPVRTPFRISRTKPGEAFAVFQPEKVDNKSSYVYYNMAYLTSAFSNIAGTPV